MVTCAAVLEAKNDCWRSPAATYLTRYQHADSLSINFVA
jgi:hypothetical protein